jgi:hypothetical protein
VTLSVLAQRSFSTGFKQLRNWAGLTEGLWSVPGWLIIHVLPLMSEYVHALELARDVFVTNMPAVTPTVLVNVTSSAWFALRLFACAIALIVVVRTVVRVPCTPIPAPASKYGLKYQTSASVVADDMSKMFVFCRMRGLKVPHLEAICA